MADPLVENADFAVDELRRKARRRLVGAVVLALAAATLLPMLLEQDQKPLGEDVSVQIPPVDNAKFVSRIKDDGTADAAGKVEAPKSDPKPDAAKAGAAKADAKPDAAKADAKVDTPKAEAVRADTANPPAKSDSGANAIPAAPQPAVMAAPAPRQATAPAATPAAVAAAPTPPQAPAAPAPAAAPVAKVAPAPATAVKAGTPAPKASARSDAEPKAAPTAEAPATAESAAPAVTPGATGTATASAPAAPPPAAGPASAPAVDAKAATTEPAKAGAFSVQLGAFTDTYGANALANKLKKQGYPAYTEPVDTSRGTMYRVRVGGYPSREAAVEARRKLKADGHDGIVQSAK